MGKTFGEYDYRCECDPAWDRGGEGEPKKAEAFVEAFKLAKQNDGPWKSVPTLPGQTPVVYVLAHVNGRAKAEVEQMVLEQYEREPNTRHSPILLKTCAYVACSMALRSWDLVDDKGEPVKIRTVRDQRTGVQLIRDDLMGRFYQERPGQVFEIGLEVIGRALNPDPL